MQAASEQKRIQQEVYAITGQHVPADDVMILAALFYAQKMQDAGREAAGQISMAGASTQAAVNEAASLLRKSMESNKAMADASERRLQASNKVLANEFERRLQKALRQMATSRPSQGAQPRGWGGVLIAGIVLGFVIFGGAMSVACDFSFSWVSDARLGAEWRRVLPTLPPPLRDKLIQHFEKLRQ